MAAFEKTQEKLDELRNLTWQNGKLIEQVEKLTKMLEEKEDSALIVEIEEAKKVLADAINTKGGNSTPDESFQQLAENIQTLPYAGISAEGIVQTEEFSFLDFCCNKDFDSIEEINDNIIKVISRNYGFNGSLIQNITFNELESITGNFCFNACNNLQSVKMPKLNNINGNDIFKDCTSLTSFNSTNLENFTGQGCFSSCSKLLEVIIPNVKNVNNRSCFNGVNTLKKLVLGVITSIAVDFMYNNANGHLNLRDIQIGNNTDVDLPFHLWTATDVIAEGQSGIDKLNSNLYNNLLTKLYDHSNDGQTRTLRLGWLAHVTQENIDYANSKGWTLTT